MYFSGLNSPDYLDKIGLKDVSITTADKSPQEGIQDIIHNTQIHQSISENCENNNTIILKILCKLLNN